MLSKKGEIAQWNFNQKMIWISWIVSNVLKSELLPTASEGWGEVIFSVCLSVHIYGGGGTPSGWRWGGTPFPGPCGGYHIQLTGGVPRPRSRWGYPLPRGYPWHGVPPSRGTLPWQGVPPTRPAQCVLATRHLVYLLRSRRRTFLFCSNMQLVSQLFSLLGSATWHIAWQVSLRATKLKKSN